MYVFFFFQAEDGIRDGRVTGVQTCALPILLHVMRALFGLDRRLGEREVVRAEADAPLLAEERPHHVQQRPLQVGERQARSEERRVGKECRTRWSPDE